MVPSPLQSFQWDDFKEIQYEPSQQALHSLNWLISDSFLRLSEEGRGGATETEFQWAVSVWSPPMSASSAQLPLTMLWHLYTDNEICVAFFHPCSYIQ